MPTAAPSLLGCLASAGPASWGRKAVEGLGEGCQWKTVGQMESKAALANQVALFGKRQHITSLKALSRFGNGNRFSISDLRGETLHPRRRAY